MTERRLPIYLLLDCSESMAGGAIEAVAHGLKTLVSELRTDPYAVESAHVSVITFSGKAEQAVPLSELSRFEEPKLRIRPGTALGAALRLMVACMKREIIGTTPDRKGDYRPLVFLLTDGQPTDDWSAGLAELRAPDSPRLANLYAIGCGPDVDHELLREISDIVLSMPDASPRQFGSVFVWLSASIRSASASIGMHDRQGAVAPIPPEFRTAAGDAAAPADPDRQLFLRARCARTGERYLMRFARQAPGGRYEAIASHPLEKGEADDAALLPPVSSSLLDGLPSCPYCATRGAAVCKCREIFCASADGLPKTCPSCQTTMTLGQGGSIAIRPSLG